MDFDSFQITGPSTSTVDLGKLLPDSLKEVSTASQCLTDTFSVNNPGGSTPPIICGTNTGEHMYVDASTACNDLTFLLGETASGTTLATRSWNIRVTQYECNSGLLAPPGCTQYFYGSDTGSVQSYNFAGDYHLANQRQNICIRRESSQCRICYSTSTWTDFQISGGDGKSFITKSCCLYGAAAATNTGMKTNKDCINIPSLVKSDGAVLQYNGICGQGGLVTTEGEVKATTALKTLCSKRQPFSLKFNTDEYEFIAKESLTANIAKNNGFRLYYFQDSTNC